MTRRHVVHWTPEAETDVMAIVDHFDDRVNADKVIVQFDKTAETLNNFPESGRVVPELRKIGEFRFREIFQRPWRMVYRIDGHDVWIVAVIDGRRALDDFLFERIIR